MRALHTSGFNTEIEETWKFWITNGHNCIHTNINIHICRGKKLHQLNTQMPLVNDIQTPEQIFVWPKFNKS